MNETNLTAASELQTVRAHRVIQRSRVLRSIDFPELWGYRSLIVALAARQLQVRYSQTVFGVAWAVFKPLISMIVFTIVFQRVARIPSDGRPYQVFSLAAIVPWSYFSTAVSAAIESLSASASMLTKVYFPRLVLPIAEVVSPLVDFAIGMILLLGVLMMFGITPAPASVLVVPLLVGAMMLTATGVGAALAALEVQYRDLRHLVPFVMQMWMYASPVVYPVGMVPARYRSLYMMNPLAGTIAVFRSVVLGTEPADWAAIVRILAISTAIFAAGVIYFRHRERIFADVV